jgi:hypothetical protein
MASRFVVRRALMAGAVAATLALPGGAAALIAQQPQGAPPSPQLAAANARLQAQDPAGAVAILEPLVKVEPRNAAAWRLLGSARHQLEQFDAAIAAYETSLTLQPNVAVALYNLACAWARKGEKDRAFEWLDKARATTTIDMTQAKSDPDLESLRGDPRFAALMPSPDDFENPFVEPVTVIREWRGEGPNDQFGWIARNVGDVDGDGVADVVTSAPTRAVGGPNAGRIYVYSAGKGTLLWTADGAPGDRLGLGVEAAGDTNRDGVPDVVASAPGRARVMVYSGRTGEVLRTFIGRSPSENFGRHVSGGDVNGDGYADVIVGAPGAGTGSRDAGRAVVYSGRDGTTLVELTGEAPGDAFGSTVAGDPLGGARFVIVGAPGAGPKHTGRAYVYAGATTTPQFVVDADDTGAALGAMFASVAGRVDGDDVADVFVSDWPNAARGPSTGRVYVHSGKDGRRLYAWTGETAGEGFGTSASNAGDVDDDGHADFIVGAWKYAGAATAGGRAYLYSGRDGSLVRTFTCRSPGDTFGFDAVGLGDVNGDGAGDLLITSAWSGVNGFRSGRVFVLSSR